jgi:hypothetical protein
MTDLEATLFAYGAVGSAVGCWLLGVDLVKQIRRTTREYRTRTITGRRIE